MGSQEKRRGHIGKQYSIFKIILANYKTEGDSLMNAINLQAPAAPVTPRNQGIRQAAAPPAIDRQNRVHYPAITRSLLTTLRHTTARNYAVRTDLPVRRFLNNVIAHQGAARPVAAFLGWNQMNLVEARLTFYLNNPGSLGKQAVFPEGTFDAALKAELDQVLAAFNSNLETPQNYVTDLFATGWADRTFASLLTLPLAAVAQPPNMPAPPNFAG